MSCVTDPQHPGIGELVFSFPYLKENVTCIAPIFWGNELVYDDFVEDGEGGREYRWPSHALGLRFQMCILTGVYSTCMIWNEDYAIMQGKNLYWNCYDENPGIAFGTENIVTPIENQTQMNMDTSVSWRINTFPQDWREGASRYRTHLLQTYDLAQIKSDRPTLAKELQVFARLPDSQDWRNALAASGIDLDRSIFIQWGNSWFLPSDFGDHWSQDYPPERLLWNPLGTQTNLLTDVAGLNAIGGHACIFTPHNLAGLLHAVWSLPANKSLWGVIEEVIRLRLHLGSSTARGFLVWQLEDMFTNFGDGQTVLPMAGAYLDTAGTTTRFYATQAEQFYNGITYDKGIEIFFRELHDSELLNTKVIFGETVNECNFAGIDLAILASEPWGLQEHKDRRLKRVHPLGAYLAGDCVKLAAHGSAWPLKYLQFHRELSYGEVTGLLPVLYVLRAEDISDPQHEHKLMLEKAKVFSQGNLSRIFPQNPNSTVLAYYQALDGDLCEYQFKDNNGRRFLRILPNGKASTIYIRIAANDTETTTYYGTGHIDDWVCYDGNDAIGLDPSRYYCYFYGRPDAEILISSLPDRWIASEIRETAQFLAVRFTSLDALPASGNIRFATGVPLEAVYFDGVPVMTSVPANDEITPYYYCNNLSGPGEIVFVKQGAQQSVAAQLAAPALDAVRATMANGFVMRPPRTSYDPVVVSTTLGGVSRSGIHIRCLRTGAFHDFARNYMDFCGALVEGNLVLDVEVIGTVGATSENTIQVRLDGEVVSEDALTVTGFQQLVIPLEGFDTQVPHVLSISYEGMNQVKVYPLWVEN